MIVNNNRVIIWNKDGKQPTKIEMNEGSAGKEEVQDPVSDPQTKDHKHEALCMISMFLGGLSFYIVNGLFHKFLDQIFQLGSRYRENKPASGWPANQHAGSVIPNNDAIGELFGLQFAGATSDDAESKVQKGSSCGQQEDPSGPAASQTPESTVQEVGPVTKPESAPKLTESPGQGGSTDGQSKPDTDASKNSKPPGQEDSSCVQEAETAPPPTEPTNHQKPLCKISMFLAGLSFYIMNGLIDTEKIKGDANQPSSDAKKAIDPGENGNERISEDENKGILELFKIDHAEDWSPISMLSVL